MTTPVLKNVIDESQMEQLVAYMVNKIAIAVPYKFMVLLANQDSTNPPNITEVFNNTGVTVTSEQYDDPGEYRLILSETVDPNLVVPFVSNNRNNAFSYSLAIGGSNDYLYLRSWASGSASDDCCQNTPILVFFKE